MSTIADIPGDPMNSLTDPTFTFHFDKYSCIREFYYAHVFFCYIIAISGLFALLTRLIPMPFKRLHPWCGRIYILSMLWSTATSLIIHNTGLPAAVLLSFLWVLIGMTLAWIIIVFHTYYLDREAAARVEIKLKNGGEIVGSLEDMIRAEKGAIIAERSVWQRFFSLKALHGILMFTSWINIVGRIFASNQSGDFTCHTYPVYKQINTPEGQFASVSDADKRLVELHNPNYSRLPWSRSITTWAIALSVGPLLGSALIGFIYSYFVSRNRPVRYVGQDTSKNTVQDKDAVWTEPQTSFPAFGLPWGGPAYDVQGVVSGSPVNLSSGFEPPQPPMPPQLTMPQHSMSTRMSSRTSWST